MKAAASSLPEVRFSRERFLAAVHYIVEQRTSDPDSLGLTKLHKSLYYSDMLSFIDRRQPLTGVEYLKAPYGPMARYLNWALKTLQADGAIHVSRRNYYGLSKYDLRCLRPIQTNLMGGYERSLLNDVIEFVCGLSAKEISELSHAAPWKNVVMGERIPYSSAYLLLPSLSPTQQAMRWADAQVQRLSQRS